MRTEEALLNDIRNGDRRAQRELYSRFAPQAMAVGMRYVADAEAARDVLHDSFVKILTSMDRFSYRGEGSLRAWVMRIVVNEAIGWLRNEKKLRIANEQFAGEAPLSQPPPGEPAEPDIGLVDDETLVRLIGQLPPGYRTVLNLFALEGLSHKQIAEQLGISIGTSASQYHRAKQLLARKIETLKKQT